MRPPRTGPNAWLEGGGTSDSHFMTFWILAARSGELDAFHDQVHGPLVDKVVYDSGNTWRIWHIRLLCMGEDKFLCCPLGLEIPPRAILHEVIHPDVYAGSVVSIHPVVLLVLCARSYNGGLQLIARCPGRCDIRKDKGCILRRTSGLGRRGGRRVGHVDIWVRVSRFILYTPSAKKKDTGRNCIHTSSSRCGLGRKKVSLTQFALLTKLLVNLSQ